MSGGTTADVCLVENGEPLFASEREFAGYPVRFPMIDVLSIGAGGGSIAWLDAGGFLHVGPQSAGAMPGPVCYGRGGTEPTVTDANLVLGRLNPAGLLGGRVPVNHEAARNAIQDKIAAPMGLSVEEAAVGILTILNENMLQAVRVTWLNVDMIRAISRSWRSAGAARCWRPNWLLSSVYAL